MTTSDHDAVRILQDNQTLHRAMAGLYDSVHPHMRNSYEQWLQTADIRMMLRHLRDSNNQPRVLDLGCGTGNLTMRFLEEGAMVTAVDMSTDMLQVLSRKLDASPALAPRCKVVELDVDRFLAHAGDAEFDLASMSSVAHHLPDYVDSLERLARRIRPGGFLYLLHEPAHKAELARSHEALRRLWSVIPRGANRMLRSADRRENEHQTWERQDTTYADYHYHRDGISVQAITDAIRPLGFDLVDLSRYNAHEASAVSWLDNYYCWRVRYEQFQRTYFRAIWRRRTDAV